MGALALARRHLRGQGARAALTAAGVACGVMLVVAIRIINASTLASFTDAIEDLAGTAALQVRGPGPFPEEVAERLRAVPGVDHAVPIVTTTFFGVEPPIAGEALSVFAADVTDGHAIRTLHLVKAGEHVVDDPLGFLVDPRSVIVTDVLAARLGVTVGAKLPLRTPRGIETFTVRGVLPPGGVGRAFGGNLILMDVVGAQLVLGEDGLIDQVDVTLAPGARVEDVEPRLRAALRAGLEAIRPARRGEQIERYLASFQTLLSGLSGLALLAAMFVAGSAVATSVAARRRELGLLRCAGAERRQVASLVLGEALVTGSVGAAAGVPLGIVLARLLLRIVTESTEIIFSMTVFTARLELSPWALVVGGAAGIGTAVLAAWLPARDAALVSPLVAARTAEPAHPVRPWRPRGAIVAAAALTGGALWAETRFASPWCGNVASVAADFALVLVFMRLAGRAAAVFLLPAREALGFAGRLAVDRLVRIPDQLALAAAVLALGLGLMMTAATVARSFEQSVLDFIRRQVRADLVVASTATTGWIEAPLDDAVGDRLAALAGVARVERLRLAEHRYRGARISIDSLDASAFAPERAADFSFAAGDARAALAAVRAGTGVLVSRNFARQFDVGVGATLRLDTPAGPLEARVAGVVVDYVSPRGSVILVRPTYVQWWGDRSVNRFHVTLAPGASLEAVRHAIATEVGAGLGLKVLTQRELYAYHQDAVRRAFRLTDALEILPLVVAALGLAEALLAVSLDRRRDFALLRAAGATRAQVARAVVGESLGVGALGLAGGLAIGLVLALLWVRVNFTYQLGWEIDFHFAAGSIPAAAAAALLVSVPAGLLPARRVARLPVVEALRAE
ncbi:MAG TPA: ABC transporter permease [Candidatus Limnocylindria bacterium]|nr:ABC transporter permease [Candidatus Limnocylindria bacterium]